MRLMITMLLLLASIAEAGVHNPPPLNSTQIWTGQAVTTAGVTSDFDHSYPVGRDSCIIVDCYVEGALEGDTVTVTPLWEMPDGNIVGYAQEEAGTPQAFTWTQGQIPNFFRQINPRNGAGRMYLQASTTATDGVTLTAKVNGTNQR